MLALAATHMPHLSDMPLQGRVKSGDVELAVRRWGAPRRPTVVLVHGYPDSSEIWGPLAQLLSNEFHVVAYDVRGAGHSDKPAGRAAYRLTHLMADFKAVIDEADIAAFRARATTSGGRIDFFGGPTSFAVNPMMHELGHAIGHAERRGCRVGRQAA
mgnify:CR=1 FL=1